MDNRVEKFLLISIDCWRYDALSRTNPTLCTPKFDLVTQDFSFADRSTSATLSGIFLFKVSGNIRESRPAIVAKMPNMITGMPAWMAPCKIDINMNCET